MNEDNIERTKDAHHVMLFIPEDTTNTNAENYMIK